MIRKSCGREFGTMKRKRERRKEKMKREERKCV